ncbi:hypothetical protein B0T20DRAFT_401588 [Sordaria brevicollis]|uniref:Uncharacterized protein n=1 Tax=Sordaria brevicollis TaxID=83679 RepID=A0AAE0UEK3_SORBR|nr:hypothetical protein B0T20DRAFT_401588 [Sordaria brevicollis]
MRGTFLAINLAGVLNSARGLLKTFGGGAFRFSWYSYCASRMNCLWVVGDGNSARMLCSSSRWACWRGVYSGRRCGVRYWGWRGSRGSFWGGVLGEEWILFLCRRPRWEGWRRCCCSSREVWSRESISWPWRSVLRSSRMWRE